MKRSKRLALAGLSVFATLALAACGTTPATDEPGTVSDSQSLTVASSAFPSNLDPHAQNESAAAIINRHIFQTLVTQTPDMEIAPNLAESWHNVDDRTVEFKIREGVTFHNGQPLTSQDVVFSIIRALESGVVSHIVGMIDPDSVVAIDDYTVQIGTVEPFSPLLNHLSHPAASVLPYGTELQDEAFADSPIGSGPFKYAGRAAGDFVRIERFDDFVGEASTLEEITFRTIVEDSTRVIALETGEVDLVLNVAPSDVRRVEDTDGLTLLREPDLRTEYLGFNFNNEFLANPLVRRAISHAIDYDGIISAVFEGIGTRARGPLAPTVFGFYDGLEGYETDMDLARELLAEAGYEDGDISLLFLVDENQQRNQMATIIANSLRQIGIEVDIQTRDWSTYLTDTGDGVHDLFLLGWTTVTGDADYGLNALFHTNNIGAAGNRTFYSNPELDDLIDRAQLETDEATRLELYREAQQIIVEDAPWAFIRHGENIVGVSNRVQNFQLHPAAHHELTYVVLGQ
ncbi:MAG: ABC transporter substrate-binding protein [Turicibacter sp.]|nr:ABC transporter substrate-binding protein [Turicibacter sp.]